jgi:2-iminobutanoate/2-iminopropanoate deaminase
MRSLRAASRSAPEQRESTLATGTVRDGIQAQTEQALRNLAAILQAAGPSVADLVKTTIFYTNIDDFPKINQVYAQHMPDPPPARPAPANVGLPSGCARREFRSVT